MTIEELIEHRKELMNASLDENKTLSEDLILRVVAPLLSENKLIDSEDLNETLFVKEDSKINAFKLNDTGERLQIFIINEKSTKFDTKDQDLAVSIKKTYDDCFLKANKFVKSSINGYFNSENLIQDGDPLGVLNSILSTSEIEQIDVIEIFLISFTASISNKGAQPDPREFSFADEQIDTTYTKEKQKYSKSILVVKRLIDLNYLYTISLANGKGLEVNVDFEEYFGKQIEVLRAAQGKNFESFLCVLSADGLANLYKKENSRLLEKNVRSFLQFTGTNKGMKKTIKSSPEKFIAFNNGLTITATAKEVIETNNRIFLKSLDGFQIVNGGQTTASLYFSKKEGLPLDGINVMAKINVVTDTNEEELNQLISDISLYSNTQTKVSKVDLNSKNEQLSKIKKFSIGVHTPTGKKWFFENKKGEYKTELLLSGKNKRVKFEKDYPKGRLISKEELGKYYMSWGQRPYLVKLGGDKLFRYFLEDLEGDGEKLKPKEINRDFYEDLIAKVILFRNLEIVHGDSRGKNNIGNLRSAVIPYTISLLFKYTEDTKKKEEFNLGKIWKSEKIEDDLKSYSYSLMVLVNKVIKKYSKTDDYGQYSKKESLWDEIKESKEIIAFMDSADSKLIRTKYTVGKGTSNGQKNKKEKDVDFENLLTISKSFDYGVTFFVEIEKKFKLTDIEIRRLAIIKNNIINHLDPDLETISINNKLLERLRSENRKEFEKILEKITVKPIFEPTLNYIIGILSDCISNNKNISSEFKKIKELANKKGVKYSAVFDTIGSKLEKEEIISMKDVYNASFYFQILNS